MKRTLLVYVFSVILVISSALCGIEIYLPQKTISNSIEQKDNRPSDDTQKDENSTQPSEVLEYTTVFTEHLKLKNGASHIIELKKDELNKLISFSSENPDYATVDDGGRIDAVKNGSALITAKFSDGQQYEYSITVCDKTKSEYDGFSTCIIANTDILNKNKKSSNDKNLYEIKVNRILNCVTVYTYDENGEYTVPIRSMICSSGKNNSTITGNFNLYFKNEWHPLYENVYGYYVSGISGDYLFHSVPYYHPKSNELKVDEYNKLGEQASLGCIRLAVADTKWIYENCPYNTPITIYDDSSEASPLGKPEAIKITDKKCGWDPTDNNKNNPYNKKTPKISGVTDVTLKVGEVFVPLENATALDTCSNDITSKIEVIGNVITSRAGTYKVTYTVTDAMHRTATTDITVTVVAKE